MNDEMYKNLENWIIFLIECSQALTDSCNILIDVLKEISSEKKESKTE